MGGVGKSTVGLALAAHARAQRRRTWWITATNSASVAGGMLEILGQLGAPESVTRLIREGEPTAADRAWEYITGSRAAGRRWFMVFDDADDPAVLSGGRGGPAVGNRWGGPGFPGMAGATPRDQGRP